MLSEKILKRWSQYFNDRDLSAISNLYAKGCILFPTFSNEIISNTEKIKEYFIKVLIEQKVSVKIEFNSVIEEKIGENYFLITGIYTFKFKRNKEINARFTFLINPMIEKPIKHHHSSQIPA